MGGCSFCFNDELNETFTAMFPEFEIVKNVGLAITKSKQVINHGLAPYFKILLDLILEKSDYLFSFHKSLNEITQTFEMDLYVTQHKK